MFAPPIFASADGAASFRPMPGQVPNPNPLACATDKRGRLLIGRIPLTGRVEFFRGGLDVGGAHSYLIDVVRTQAGP